MNTAHHKERDIELFKYPFDQYQRYQDVKIIIDQFQASRPDKPLQILDVGGSPETAIFLPDYQIVTLNLETQSDLKVQGDGTILPFKDGSFPVVITVDTLEHIPPHLREPFVKELLRVSGDCTIITGPFSNGYNEQAETILNDFLTEVIGLDHRFLQEHLQHGLPSLEECLPWVSSLSEHHLAIPSGYIHHWLPLMIIKHYVHRLSDGGEISAELDRFYNYHSYWSDHKLPSYRHIVVALQKDEGYFMLQLENIFEADESSSPDLNGILSMWQSLRWVQILEERDEEINRLKHLITQYESGKFMRLMAVIHQIKQFFKH